jgi:hypothetical protein
VFRVLVEELTMAAWLRRTLTRQQAPLKPIVKKTRPLPAAQPTHPDLFHKSLMRPHQ